MAKLYANMVSELLSAVGDHLAAGGNSASIVTVGGSTLAARGWIDRVTADVDVIAQGTWDDDRRVLIAPDPLPSALQEAVALEGR